MTRADRIPLIRGRIDGIAERVQTEQTSDDSETVRGVSGGVALQYREPAKPAPVSPASPMQPQTDKAELIKQFGNLIEGADAGLTPSFDIGSRGIGDAMAVIEQTAEKVEANSKLIEELRAQQRQIETVSLKSSDLDRIAEEMTRRLRSRIRLDRSRFAGT